MSKKPPPNATCEVCGVAFYFTPARRKAGKRQFCSTKCSGFGRRVPPEVRFWYYVTKGEPDECWEWRGTIGSHGYGTLTCIGDPAHVRTAPWISFKMHNGGPPAAGLHICHKCNNKKCVNPNHLYAGTRSQNMMDRRAAGTANSGERNGQCKLTDAQFLAIMQDKRPGLEIAREYGIHRNYAYDIKAIKSERAKALAHLISRK